MKILFLALGGALGTVLRYALAGLVQARTKAMFPIGTLAVNLSGCFVIGFLWAVAERRDMHPNVRVFVFVGILGGFTTFSSYALETFSLLRGGESILALTNILLSNLGGLALAFLGFNAGRVLLHG